MRTTWLTAAAAAALTLTAAPAACAGVRIDPAVAAALRSAAPAPAQRIDALVVLRRQAALPSGRVAGRAARLRGVVTALRDTAAVEQRRIVALLTRRRAAGLVTSVRPFWILDGLEVVAAPSVIAELAALPEVQAVRANATIAAPPAQASAAPPEPGLALVGAPALWSRGWTGDGVVVANLDSGVDVSHPDLSARWRGGSNSWFDPNGQHPTTPTDVSGHGTWTMGVMVGGEAGGSSVGMAPGARWIAAKIFDDRGIATTARIHSAFQWLLDPDGDPATADAPHVVEGSWTMGNPGCDLEFQLDLRGLRSAGILPVFAAGNAGPAAGTSLSPANNPEAFAVGDTDVGDLIDATSSRGPSSCDQSVYPELTAPGVDVRTTDLFGFYTSQTGSSLAAPHAAGALALLLQAFPGVSAERQQAALEQGAFDLGATGPDDTYGNGRLDALAAHDRLATAPDFALTATPSSATTPAGGSVTYAVDVAALHGFADDVALSLQGLSAAQGTPTFTPATVTGGAGSSQLTVTTAATLPPGSYPLTIRGTSGSDTRSVSVTLTVAAPPDFTLSATPASASVLAGSSASYTLNVGAQGGFQGDVALSLSGLSATQATWTFTPATVAGGTGSAQLTVTPSVALAPGSYPLTIAGTSGALRHTVTVTLVVSAAPDFTLSATPPSVTVTAGQSASYQVTVSRQGGFAGAVSLSVSGLPSAATGSFAPNPVSTTSTLTVRTARTTTRGTFRPRITGRSGSLTRQTTVTLVVR